jgi:thiamine pyrophosphokinase
MLEQCSELKLYLFAVFMEQLMALGVVLGDLDSAATKAFIDLKNELAKEKVVRETAQTKVEILTWAVRDLKISANRFVAQIPVLEEKVSIWTTKSLMG